MLVKNSIITLFNFIFLNYSKIGFNRGNGTNWYPVKPFSENAQLIEDLADHSNIGTDGRFIFRIDEWIQPAGCLDIDFDGTGSERKLFLICFNNLKFISDT